MSFDIFYKIGKGDISFPCMIWRMLNLFLEMRLTIKIFTWAAANLFLLNKFNLIF